MRFRSDLAALLCLTALSASPVQAHDHGSRGPHHDAWGYPGPGAYGSWQSYSSWGGADRDAWLQDCRRRLSDNGLGGAVIGGIVGGVAGNVIAGDGNRTVGTVAGAAVGAVAGSAIDKAEDRGPARDRCEAMLMGLPSGGAPYGYMMVPVMMVPVAQPGRGECKETVVTEEYDVAVPRRSRMIPRRAPDKRVRIVPDKRVPQ